MTFFDRLFTKTPKAIAAEKPAQVFNFESNPAPENITAKHVTTPDNIRLRCVTAKSSHTPNLGTIILLHGRNESSEKYFETMRDFNARGFDVLTFDWRGQGDSERLLKDRMRGYVRKFSDYLIDLGTVIEQIVLPDCRGPFFIVAHSTGALVALTAVPQLKNRVDRMVLLAPYLGMRDQKLSTEAAGWAGRIMTWMGLGKVYMVGGPRPKTTRPFKNNLVTSDPQRYERNSALFEKYRHLALGGPTARWVAQSVTAMNVIQKRLKNPEKAVRMPILMVIAGADRIVSNMAIEDVARQLPGASTLRIENAAHELLQEQDRYREQVLSAIYAFIPGTKGYEWVAEKYAARDEIIGSKKSHKKLNRKKPSRAA